jgi:hypothetical protein
MADINTVPMQSMGPDEEYVFEAGFVPNGAANPVIVRSNFNQESPRAAITRTGLGAYLITFQDRHPAPFSLIGQVSLATPADARVNFGAFNTPAVGPSTLPFSILTAAGVAIAADLTNVAGNNVSIRLAFKKRASSG